MKINAAMILAAGRGVRMRELTGDKPKPLLQVQGKGIIHHITDRLKSYGIDEIVVNTCYKGDMIKRSLNERKDVRFIFSDEVSALETGGGVKKALPLLTRKGQNGFFVLNGDPLWSEPGDPLLNKMADAWDPDQMDILLAIEPVSMTKGDTARGNYFIENGRLRRILPEEESAPYFFMSAQIMHPRVFQDAPEGPFSSRILYDQAQAKGRLAYVLHDGTWFNINTPEALQVAEAEYRP